jgi:hypothetical protein
MGRRDLSRTVEPGLALREIDFMSPPGSPGEYAVWDDGEWIPWDYINEQVYKQELRERFPDGNLALIEVFEQIIDAASQYRLVTGRYLPVFGELGEIFAELTLGLERHKPRAQGSDGRIGNDHVEVKTISPENRHEKVVVKRKGHFSKLVLVKIDEDFNFEARTLDRKELAKGKGPVVRVYWSSGKS